MFSNHINQFVHLVENEYPRVFTNFENQIGEYSVAYKRAEQDFTVIKKIVKNQYNHDLIVQYRDGTYDILHFRTGQNITEDYGYRIDDCLPDIKEGDTVSKGQFIYKSTNYDDDGNFSYGRNLRAIYIPYKNMTYEDGVVISKSAAEKLTSFKVEKTMFSVNGNDILVNLYGDDETYNSFPKIGQHIDSNVLVALRRREKRTALYDFQSNRIREIDPTNDEIIYTGGGTVVDIDIFSNQGLVELRKKTDVFSQEILVLVEDQYRYWTEMAEALEEIIPCKQLSDLEFREEHKKYGHVAKHPIEREKNPNKFTDELAYYWKLAHENIDEKIQWRHDGKSFESYKIQFTILKENHLTPGCKITGRLEEPRCL